MQTIFEKGVDKDQQGWEDGITNREMRNESVQLLHGPPSEEQAAGRCEVSRGVLDVLHSQLSWIGPCRPDGDEIDSERWDRIEEARAAVAELIEVAEAISKSCITNYGDGMGLHLDLAASGGLNDRLVAALARVRGAA